MDADDRTRDDQDAAARALAFQGRYQPAPPTRDTEIIAGDQQGLPHLANPPGRFAVVGLLGRGGSGEVWEFRDQELDRAVAVKVQLPHAAEDLRRRQRFIDEARLTAGLEHPGVLPVYDLGSTSDGRRWFAMRRAQGLTLAEALATLHGPEPHEAIRTIADRVQLLVRVCDAVAYAHDRGIVHCDLKPGNIMLGSYGEVVVLDWGTAILDGTQRGVVGTPAYMSPEQARGEPADRRSDVYGLGATLWHLLTLRLPLSVEPADQFWERKRRGDLERLPVDIPADLARVLGRALAADRSERFADASAFAGELRQWLRCREGAALSERAQADLARLATRGDHAGFTRARDDLAHAARLGDGEAARLLPQATAAHARYAISHGDLALANELVQPGSPEAALLEQARRRKRRLRVALWTAGSLATAALLFLSIGLHQAWRDRTAAWHLLWERGQGTVWQDGDLLSAQASLPRTDDGVLVPANQLVRVAGCEESGDVRVTMDVTWPERIDGLHLMIGADLSRPVLLGTHMPAGTCFHIGGFMGLWHNLMTVTTKGQVRVRANAGSDLVVERRYRIEAMRRSDRLELAIDGQTLLTCTDPDLLRGDLFRSVAVRTWAPVRIHSMRIERLGLPARPEATDQGDLLLTLDMPSEARQAYLRVADDHAGTTLGERALLRAVLAACTEPAGDDALCTRLHERLATAYPASALLKQAEEALIVARWRRGSLDALVQAEDLLRRHPDSRVIDTMLQHVRSGLPAATVAHLLRLLRQTPGIICLRLPQVGLESLDALQGLPLQQLVVSGNRISDLRPLAGMPLRELVLDQNPVSDLGPLRGMPLRRLSLDSTQVADLAPLAGMPLARLSIIATPVRDLAPLRQMRLQILGVSRTGISSLAPIDASQLLQLDCASVPITDITPLARGTRLTSLNIARCPITDVGPLSRHRGLTNLNLTETKVADLTPLRGLPLTTLRLTAAPVTDLRPLLGSPLQFLSLDSCPITTLTGLERSPIQHFYAHQAVGLTSLTGLQPGPLLTCRIAGTRITDLGPLASASQLRDLHVPGTCDPSVLHRITSLQTVRVDAPVTHPAEWEALHRQLIATGRTEAAHALGTILALHRGDAAALRLLAVHHAGRLRLRLPGTSTVTDALRLAQQVRARLLCIRDAADEERLQMWLSPPISCWLGLGNDQQGTAVWDDGRPIGSLDRRPTVGGNQPDERWRWFQSETTNGWFADPTRSPTTAGVVLEWDATAP